MSDPVLVSTQVFALDNEDGTKHWSNLKSRVVEHVRAKNCIKLFDKLNLINLQNIQVMAKYYAKITLS